MPMTRFETGSYWVESDHSDNCATRESNYVEKILKELIPKYSYLSAAKVINVLTCSSTESLST